MTENVQLMRDAKATLNGKWGYAAIGMLVYMIISCVASGFTFIPFIGWIATMILLGPIYLGYILFIISLRGNKEDVKIETLFGGFNDFTRSFVTYLLMTIFIILWTCLLIIPGLIMGIAYSMTFFIIAEDKSISAYEAIKKSRRMMYGYKWKYFCLSLRFLGWTLLACMTFGIGLFWLMPYMESAFYNFYLDIKNNPAERVETPSTPMNDGTETILTDAE